MDNVHIDDIRIQTLEHVRQQQQRQLENLQEMYDEQRKIEERRKLKNKQKIIKHIKENIKEYIYKERHNQ